MKTGTTMPEYDLEKHCDLCRGEKVYARTRGAEPRKCDGCNGEGTVEARTRCSNEAYRAAKYGYSGIE